MDESRTKKVVNAAAWGALFIWWGISLIPHLLPNGLDAAGTGVILLAANLWMVSRALPADGFTLFCGVLCLAWGGLDLSRSVFNVPYRLPVFAILLILAGVMVFVGGIARLRMPPASGTPGPPPRRA